MRYYVAVMLVLASGLVLATDIQTTIPKQFLGEWGASRAGCLIHNTNSVDTDDLIMWIKPSSISFYEGSAKVLVVVTSGELDLALIVERSGDGDTWLDTLQYRLSADKNTVTDVTGDKKSPVRVRCQGTVRK